MDLRATSPAAPILVVQHVLPRYVCISPTHRIGVFLAPAAFIVPKLASVMGALGVFALLFGAIWAFTATFRATKPAATASPAATMPAKGSAAKTCKETTSVTPGVRSAE